MLLTMLLNHRSPIFHLRAMTSRLFRTTFAGLASGDGSSPAESHAKREEQQKVLMCVDAIHGFGVQDIEIKESGSLLAEASTFGVGCSLTALLQNDIINHVGRHRGAKTEQRFYLVRRLDL
jgi:hypothetical protein